MGMRLIDNYVTNKCSQSLDIWISRKTVMPYTHYYNLNIQKRTHNKEWVDQAVVVV